MKKLLFAITVLALLPLPFLSAWDWGLSLDQTAAMENVDREVDNAADSFTYSGTLIPWYSTPLGSAGRLFLSASFSLDYDEKPFFVPQILRTEYVHRMGNGGEFKVGRMLYDDPLGFIASGLFDGASYSLNTGNKGRLGFGVWYTGLLYKKNLKITMTGEDLASYDDDLDYSNFGSTYFASRRLVAAIDWDSPQLTEWLRFKTALIGQFDLNGNDEYLHSQYLTAKAIMPMGSFIFNLGMGFELAQTTMYNDDSSMQVKLGLAGEAGASWMLPTSISDRLTLTGRFSNGTVEDSAMAAFSPITNIAQGDVLQAKLSGLSMIRLDYTAKLHQSFSFYVASSYFILSDLGSYTGKPSEKDGYFLGNEFSGRLVWSPVSDLRISLGGGVFLPSMGNADNGGDTLWRVELNAILVFF